MLFILAFLGFFRPLEAQVLELKRVFSVEAPITTSADGQGNIYLSTRGGEIKKYSPTGILIGTFSPQSAGSFNILDASSALQLRAFNENSQTIVYLDRFLNQTASFQLPTELFPFANALCWSAGNTVWVANAADMELVRWRIDSREVVRTLQLNQFITDDRFEIKNLQEHQHKLYLFSSNLLYIFDQLGNYEKQVPLSPWKSVAFSEHGIIMLGNTSLTLFDLYGTSERILPLPEGTQYEQLSYSKGEIYLFSKKEANIYGFTP